MLWPPTSRGLALPFHLSSALQGSHLNAFQVISDHNFSASCSAHDGNPNKVLCEVTSDCVWSGLWSRISIAGRWSQREDAHQRGTLQAILARSGVTLQIMSRCGLEGEVAPTQPALRGFRGRSRGNLNCITSSGHPNGLKIKPHVGGVHFK